ncbi:MAG: hypothetical protein GC137_04570 [Alphaproteobacteria bacterium]|nr:hypothetical protein [Alphaproteobacteria bacterium]
MSLLIRIKEEFERAVQRDPSLCIEPSVAIDLETIQSILAPVKQLMIDNPACDSRDLTISKQIEELRRMCLEAQAAHTTQDPKVKEERCDLLNTLQELLEKVSEVEHVE